ncbi:hypothetical protein PLICRDRAFT_110586, partial [Plicaturopsis crispa FD-325 SS-3]
APMANPNPEEGMDAATNPKGRVLDYVTHIEVDRRIAFTASMVQPRPAANSAWSFQKVLGDDDFIAAGQLVIPPKVRKPTKSAKDNTYVFYVIEGAVNVTVHKTSLVVATGGMFLIPRGNTYSIEAISERDAKLFFTQARKVPASEEEEKAASRGPKRHSSTPVPVEPTVSVPVAPTSSAPASPSSSLGDKGGEKDKSREGKTKRAVSRLKGARLWFARVRASSVRRLCRSA